MRCPNCNRILKPSMKFCVFCGHNLTENTTTEKYKYTLDQIEEMITTKEYKKLFDIAKSGNLIAQSICINNITLLKDKSDVQKFLSLLDDSVFAIAARGHWEFIKNINSFVNEDAFNKGIRHIKEAAQKDDASAQVYIAKWMLDGLYGFEKDVLNGFKLMKSQAEKKYPPAIRKLGIWYKNGSYGVVKDVEKGQTMIEEAAFLGDQIARDLLLKDNPSSCDTDTITYVSEKEYKKIKSLTKMPENNYESIASCNFLNYLDTFRLPDTEDTALNHKLDNCETIEKILDIIYSKNADKFGTAIQSWGSLCISKSVGFTVNCSKTGNEILTIDKINTKIRDYNRAIEIASKYDTLNQFLNYKEDLKKNQIFLDDAMLGDSMKKVSVIISEKHSLEIRKYANKDKLENDLKETNGFFGAIAFLVVWFFIFTVVSKLIPALKLILKIVYCFFVFFTLLTVIARLKIKSKLKKDREIFSLIDALYNYGYKLTLIKDIN